MNAPRAPMRAPRAAVAAWVLLCPAVLVAQIPTQPSPVAVPASAPPSSLDAASAPVSPDDELVELNPFVVDTRRDVGYIAENTLAGSRLNSRLSDTPGSVSVITREFLDDLAIADVRQLVDYTLNSEVDVEARNAGNAQNSIINAQNLNGAILTRGISASQGLDYFPTIAPSDSYRVGRYEDSRGPNSILFGVGPGGGMLNQSSKIAVPSRNSATVRLSAGSWSRRRAEVDANHVLRRDVLALSVATVQQDSGGWRNFDSQEKDRWFGSITFRPLRRISLTAMGETGRDRGTVIRNVTESEEVLAWYDNRNARGIDAVTFAPNNVEPSSALQALGVVARNGNRGGNVRRLTFIENDGTLFDASGTFLTGTYNNAAVRAPDGTPGVTASVLRINDPRLYPYFNNATGPGMYRDQKLGNYTATCDIMITRDLFLNIAHNFQQTDLDVRLMTGTTPVLRGEANRLLGIGGPPNPYAGRLYLDGEWRRDLHYRDFKESRAALSWKYDTRSPWLGVHRLAVLLSHTAEYDERANSYLVLAGHPFNANPTNINNRVFVRNYIVEGDYGTYRVGDWRSLPSEITFNGRTYPLLYANDAAGGGTNGAAYQNTNTRLAVIQSHLLREKLVATVGMREDRVRITELGYRVDPDLGDVVDPDPAKRTVNWFTGKTHTYGAVAHLSSWLSVLANYSTGVGVPSFSRTVLPEGHLADPPESEGYDVGIGFNFLRGQANAKIVYFGSKETGATGAFGANATVDNRNRRVTDAFAGALVGAGRPFSTSDWAPVARTLTPPVSGALADFESEGVEVRFTGNLTPNWRLLFNYSYTDSGRSRIYEEVIAWYGLKPVSAHAVAQGVAQDSAGRYLVDPSAFLPGGIVARWLELAALHPSANPATLVTGTNLTLAREIYDLVDEVNAEQLDQEKRYNLRPHKVSVFTAYDFRTGPLKGVGAGMGVRWRSANIIGTNSSGEEISGVQLFSVDLMLRYVYRPSRLPGRFSFQLNVNNLLDRTDIVPQRLATSASVPDGFIIPGGRGQAYSRYDLVDPREFRFTTTWSF